MMDNRKISVCIPYYNNSSIIMETLSPLIDDDRISEIVITDDYSQDFDKLLQITKGIKKIKVYRNVVNFHILHNKHNSIHLATNEWAIILDSDNVAGTDYINKLYSISKWESKTIYSPDFAYPNFDYRCFSGKTLNKSTIKDFSSDSIFQCFLNTFNYFINRDEYLKIYRYDSSCRGADSIYFNSLWLGAGNDIYIVPGLSYFHRVHEKSTFILEGEYNMQKADEIYKDILKM